MREPLALVGGLMHRLVASILLLASAAVAGVAAPAGAEPVRAGRATELSGQSANPPRARTRITVTPARRLVRECDFHLAREVRASGVYVVPRQRCWWARK